MLSGAVLLTPSWRREAGLKGNVWSTPVPEGLTVAALRVNGERAVRARYPNAPPGGLAPSGWISARTSWLPRWAGASC